MESFSLSVLHWRERMAIRSTRPERLDAKALRIYINRALLTMLMFLIHCVVKTKCNLLEEAVLVVGL